MNRNGQQHKIAYSLCALAGIILGIGIGAAWVRGGSPDSSKDQNVDSRSPSILSMRESDGQQYPHRTKPIREKTDEGAKSQFRVDQIDRQINSLHEKFEVRLEELKVRLGLRLDQVEKLRSVVNERITQYQSDLLAQDPALAIGWRIDMLNVSDRSLEALLDSKQQEEYQAIKDRERNARIEARALVDLAKLATLDLSDEQMNHAFQILVEKITIDFDDTPMIPNFQALPEDDLPQANKTLEENLERMRGVLDSNQLSIYRERLKSELGMFNIIKRN